jgi:hypothetical protein
MKRDGYRAAAGFAKDMMGTIDFIKFPTVLFKDVHYFDCRHINNIQYIYCIVKMGNEEWGVREYANNKGRGRGKNEE